MRRPRFPKRRDLTARERVQLGVWQTLLWVGVLCTARGLASITHWLFAEPGTVAGSNAFSPLDPGPALVALLVGPALCIAAAVVADRRRPPAAVTDGAAARPAVVLRPAFSTGVVQ